MELEPLDKYITKKIIDRCLDLMLKTKNEECFLVFTGLLETLNFEYNKGLLSNRNNKLIKYNTEEVQSLLYELIFKNLWDLEDVKIQSLDLGIDTIIFYISNVEYRIIPYLVSEKNSTHCNIGNRGFAGKLRDNSNIRKNNTCILIFDPNPIDTLSTATEINVLTSIFSKDSIKKDLIRGETPKWYEELVKCFFNDKLLHTLNVVDRLNILLKIRRDGYSKNLNSYIKSYRMPLFYLDLAQENEITKNYELFCKINNENLEPITQNFDKETIQEINLNYLPCNIEEADFIDMLKCNSLHESLLYEFEALNYNVILNIFSSKVTTKIIGIDSIKPNNSIYYEIPSKNKKKSKIEGILNKGNLKKLKIRLKGNFSPVDKFYTHYYFNNFTTNFENKLIDNGEVELKLDNIDQFQTLNIIINEKENSISKPIITSRFMLQQGSDGVICPEVDGDLQWEKGDYFPTIILDDTSNLQKIACKYIKENGDIEKVKCKVVSDETLEDGRIKFNIEHKGKVVTKVLVGNIEEKALTYRHLIHFIVEKSIRELDFIELKSGEYTSFQYKNKQYNHYVDVEFERLLRNFELSSINELFKLILENKDEYYFELTNDENKVSFQKCISSDSSYLLEKRKLVLESFINLYENNQVSLWDKFKNFNSAIRMYLEEFCKQIEKDFNLVKLDTIEIGNKRIFSPFSPVNLAFYLMCWDNFIENSSEDKKVIDLFKKLIDNCDTIKYIRSDSGWYTSKDSPSFLWTYYVLENSLDNYGRDKYLDSVFQNKIRQLEYVYPYIFSNNKQTVHIGILNPGDCKFIVNGMLNYINNNFKDNIDNMPYFHITLIYNKEESLFTELERIFEKETKNTLEEMLIGKLSYSKISYDNARKDLKMFYHLLFVKDIFIVSNNDDNMKNNEQEYINTYFCNGFNAGIINKSEYGASVVAYKTYSNYMSDVYNENMSIYEKVLSLTNAYYPQAFANNISDSKHPVRMVNIISKDIPYELFFKAFMVIFLDREIDIDIFNSENLNSFERPFLVDYSNYSDKNGGIQNVKFLTITNQKEPFVEIFKNALKYYREIKTSEKVINKLFDDLNLLNGFWVLELLRGSNNINKTKGIIGTIAAFRFLQTILKDDSENWHLIIGIEQFIGVSPEYSSKLPDRFNDEGNNLYCDDLAVISFPKKLNEDKSVSIQLQLVEVKNSNILEYVKKGFDQLEATEKMLKRIFLEVDDRVKNFRAKEIVNWLIYYRNKYCVFNNDYLNINSNWNDEFSKILRDIIDKINHGYVNINVGEGVLININAPNVTDSIETEAIRKYVPIRENEFITLINGENTEIKRYDNLLETFKAKNVIIDTKEKGTTVNEPELEEKYNYELSNQQQCFLEKIEGETHTQNLYNIKLDNFNDNRKVENKTHNDFKLFIGRRITSSGELIFYDPKKEGNKLPNMNIMITGSSGKGKTQLLKSMITQGRKQDAKFLIFDFKNDFGDQDNDNFLKNADLNYIDLEFEVLPYNPLIPPKKVNQNKQYINVQAHVYDIAGAFKDVYGLGPQQEASLKEVIRQIYKNQGFDVENKNVEFKSDMVFPILDEVGELLKEKDIKAYNRLEPVFNYGLFGNKARKIALSDLLNESYVLGLNNISNDEIKKAISKLIVLSAHQYLNTLPHSDFVKNVFIFDEAHRFLKDPRLNTLVRECRAYGLAIWLSSQYPKDYSKEISGNLDTKIIHGNDNSEENVNAIREITGFDGPAERITELGLFNSIIVSSHYDKAFINTLSYPHTLVLKEIRNNGYIDLNSFILGVQPARLTELIRHLVDMKLIFVSEEKKYKLTENGAQVINYFI